MLSGKKLFKFLVCFVFFYIFCFLLILYYNGNFLMNKFSTNQCCASDTSLTLAKITNIVQERLLQLQFPTNCSRAKKLLCHVPRHGLGSQMHITGYCFTVAYITGRTLLPIEEKFNYSPELGWNHYFMPITNCTSTDIQNRDYRLINESRPDVEVLEINGMKKFFSLAMPPAFPSTFAPTLLKYHSNPPLFWAGQFQTYLMQYQPALKNLIENTIAHLNFHEPIVGIHVRRTDKVGTEALRFEVEEYMVHVTAWYNRREKNENRPRIFLLTDEPGIINATIRQYPQYEFVYEYPSEGSRYTDASLLDIILGIHILTRCSYVVCTFTSNVCRLAYELAQVIRQNEDASYRFLSLDVIYYVYNQQSRLQIATEDHATAKGNSSDLQFLKGDTLEVDNYRLSGFSKQQTFDEYFNGRNLRTGKRGHYPIEKVHEKWRIVDF